MKTFKTIDDYINSYSADIQKLLQQMRSTIKKAAPEATEAISYGIPTFKQNGNLVHFGGYETHIGFYPGAEAIEMFKDSFKGYKTSKGTVQFPVDQPLPLELVTKITKYRVKQNVEKQK